MSATSTSGVDRRAWGSDFFGTLNTLPPEPVNLLARVLEAMRTEPAFHEARRAMLADLGVRAGARVLEAGCGTGAALPDLLDLADRQVEVTGIDPTEAFIELARQRAAELGCSTARYDVGDARALPYPEAAFGAAFCEKLLLHVGPAETVLAELVRAVEPDGRVGALEWLPVFAISTSRPEIAAALNDALRQAVYDFMVSANLARHFQAVGLVEIKTRAYLAYARRLDAHPFWRAFLIDQAPMFAHAGLISESQQHALVEDLERLDRQGVFTACCVVHTAVGTKPARRI